MVLTTSEIKAFQRLILDYYRANARPFPWRVTRDPYAILVSEVMLQQTQTYRVLPKYEAFLGRFPSVHDLAAAPLSDVLLYWQGLGYNRRALMLKRAAETIVQQCDGYFPDDPETLQTLPGVGPYTACAVSTFAFEHPNVFIETNIRTVFLHHFFPDQENVRDKVIMPLVAQTLHRKSPRDWYYALMDYGVLLKKLHGNANKRSAHYTKQSKFEGSDRQIRGEVIRQLLAGTFVDAASTACSMQRDTERVQAVIEQLQQDGLVRQHGTTFTIV